MKPERSVLAFLSDTRCRHVRELFPLRVPIRRGLGEVCRRLAPDGY